MCDMLSIFFQSNLFLTANLAISYIGPAAVPVWLLLLQLQVSSTENVSYHLYTCTIYIQIMLMDWNHQAPKLLYIMCCATFQMDHSRFIENRGHRPEKN
jgi:hypothetical protein